MNQTSDAKAPPPVRGSLAIAAELRRSILDGAYGHSERLPAERQLAALFGASRSTVRQALERLEQTGLVSRRIGSGTFISFQPAGAEGEIADIVSPLELIEVRLALEPHMTRLAVVNATGRDLELLAEALAEVENSALDAEAFSRCDEKFHSRLARCTQNQLLISIYDQVNEVRGHAQWNAMKDKILTRQRMADYNRGHRALYEALCSRDVDQALAIIGDHLEAARRDLLGASSA